MLVYSSLLYLSSCKITNKHLSPQIFYSILSNDPQIFYVVLSNDPQISYGVLSNDPQIWRVVDITPRHVNAPKYPCRDCDS